MTIPTSRREPYIPLGVRPSPPVRFDAHRQDRAGEAVTDEPPLDLAAVRSRAAARERADSPDDTGYCLDDDYWATSRSADDVPILLAEIERLRESLARYADPREPANRPPPTLPQDTGRAQ